MGDEIGDCPKTEGNGTGAIGVGSCGPANGTAKDNRY